MSEIRVSGIDVSVWQGAIDWKKVKAAGVKFAMIRLGAGDYRRVGRCLTDSRFSDNVEQALAAGLDVGVYFYSYALSVDEARREGEYVRNVLEGYKGKLTYPVAFDLEDPSQQHLGKDVLSGMVAAFAGVLEQAGYYVSLYTMSSWLKTKLDASVVGRYDVWLAEWTSRANPTYTGAYGMWQYAVLGKQGTKGKEYTFYGEIDGINANVDVNYAFKDYPSIIRGSGLNGFKRPGEDDADPNHTYELATETDCEIDWSQKGLEMLTGAGAINGQERWNERLEQPITVGELFGILARLYK